MSDLGTWSWMLTESSWRIIITVVMSSIFYSELEEGFYKGSNGTFSPENLTFAIEVGRDVVEI